MDTQKLIEDLLKAGYPKESIIENYSEGLGNHYLDIAIIDPKTKKIIAAFELKEGDPKRILQPAIKQINGLIELFPHLSEIVWHIIHFLPEFLPETYETYRRIDKDWVLSKILAYSSLISLMFTNRICYKIISLNRKICGKTYCEVLAEYQNATNDDRTAEMIIEENPEIVKIVLARIEGAGFVNPDNEHNCRLALEILVEKKILKRK